MTDHFMIKSIKHDLDGFVARLGQAPDAPHPVEEAREVYADIRPGDGKRGEALAGGGYFLRIPDIGWISGSI